MYLCTLFVRQMKIIGFVYNDGQTEMVLKGDSCLLNGKKPFFIPDHTSEVGVTDCIILRVSRLGKEIAPKFASRYYDAIAPGADFAALDILREAKANGKPWTQAIGFDYSLAIGEFIEPSAFSIQYSDFVLSPEEAVAQASKVMTIRQGDLIYIQAKQAPRKVQKEDIIRYETDGKETLFCKIK